MNSATSYLVNGVVVNDTFYFDKDANTKSQVNTYTVKGIDSCLNQSAASIPNKTILLSAQNINDNNNALLNYTPYEFWKEGIDYYSIEVKNNSSWVELIRLSNATITYVDNNFPDTLVNQNAKEKCYRIRAFQKNGVYISQSNESCVPFAPIVFIPTAFSPNNDGLNGYFRPILLGMNVYELQIYNRWGEIVYTSTDLSEDKEWDGTFRGEKAEAGIYIFRFIATSAIKSNQYNHAANFIEKKGTLMLFR